MTLGEKILTLRKRSQMSQEQLADRLGVSRQSVSKWELGEAAPDVGNLVAIGEVFGVSLDALLKEERTLEDASPPADRETDVGRFRAARGAALGVGYGAALFLGLLIAAILCTRAGILGRLPGSVLIGTFAFLALGELIHFLIVFLRK